MPEGAMGSVGALSLWARLSPNRVEQELKIMNQPFKSAFVSLRRHTATALEPDRLTAANASSFPSSLSLSLRQSASSDPGSKPATARSLGTFPGKRKIKGTVGKKDKDVYQLVFDDFTDLRVTFKNRSQVNIFGEILDSQGQVFTFKGDKLSIKIKPGEAIEDFYEELPSGTYFLRFRSKDAGKNAYQLKLSAANTFPSLPDCGCTP